MTLGLVAWKYHAPVLKMYLELLREGGYEVVLYTNRKLLREMEDFFHPDPVPATVVPLPEGEIDTGLIRSIASDSQRLDALLYVELHAWRPSAWEALLRESFHCPLYTGIHDLAREWGDGFAHPPRFGPPVTARLRRQVFARFAGFVAHSPWIQRRLETLAPGKRVCYLPVSFRDRRFRRTGARREGPLAVCVPGGIAGSRRDYLSALRAVRAARRAGAAVELKLVGPPLSGATATIFTEARAVNEADPGSVAWTEEYQDEPAFRARLQEADVILAPLIQPPSLLAQWLRRDTRTKHYVVDTHITAATYDAIRFQMPIVYPSFYMKPPYLHPGAAVYASVRDLSGLLGRLEKDREELAALTRDMARYAERFTPQAFLPFFRKLLEA